MLAFEEEFIRNFMCRLDDHNQRAQAPGHRLKPNLNQEWLEKIQRCLQ